MAPLQLQIREVWHSNLESEFSLISQSLQQFPFVSMDTEFPGTVYGLPGTPNYLLSSLPPTVFYAVMKQNIDALNLIQLGLTLSDAHGNLPHFGTGFHYVWQFNFRDFDSERDLQNPESIALLKRHGIDFLKNKHIGIDSQGFASLFKISVCIHRNLTWITFHGPYDFGFLIKILIGTKLPDDFYVFMRLMRFYFGEAVYDLKHIIRFFGLGGGLERVAKNLNVERVAGQNHQAGSDSLLTMQVYVELRKNYMNEEINNYVLWKFNHMLYGLTSVI